VSTYRGRKITGVELPWRGSIDIVVRQSRFFDSVLALAGLPKSEEWTKILQLSKQYDIPVIWERARPSVLENDVAALLTGLAFSGRSRKLTLIQQFFKFHDLKAGLRGRPRLHPRELTDTVRGIRVDKLIAELAEGFAIKQRAKRTGGFASGHEPISAELKARGYGDQETVAILQGATPQDAALRLYFARFGKRENVTPKGIQNSYAAYKHRKSGPSHRDVPTTHQ
jgi:hypothetical protein